MLLHPDRRRCRRYARRGGGAKKSPTSAAIIRRTTFHARIAFSWSLFSLYVSTRVSFCSCVSCTLWRILAPNGSREDEFDFGARIVQDPGFVFLLFFFGELLLRWRFVAFLRR